MKRRKRPLWKGYVFCGVDENTAAFLKKLSFVTEVQHIDNENEILEILNEVRSLLDDGKYFLAAKRGDLVEVSRGPLKGFKGVVERVTSDDRVMVKVQAQKFEGRVIFAPDVLTVSQHSDDLQIVQAVDEIAYEKIRLAFEPINAEMIKYLAKRPEFLHKMHSYRFEILVADLLKDMGYDVQLTPQTRDGGRDILAAFKIPEGEVLTVVDCKRFAFDRKIGPDLVQRLLWVSEHNDRASRAMMASKTYYTTGARAIEKEYKWKLSMKDYDAITGWISNYGQWKTLKHSGLWVPKI